MQDGGDGMKKLSGLDALADLHRAMGGEKAEEIKDELSPDEGLERGGGPSVLYVSRDKKARKGKEVTLVEGWQVPDHDMLGQSLAKALKAHCGVGGGWKEGQVLLQGDHRERVAAWLRKEGYSVKMKGG